MLGVFRDAKDKPKSLMIAAAVGVGIVGVGYWLYLARQRTAEGKCPFTGKSKADKALGGVKSSGAGCPFSKGKAAGDEQYQEFKMKNLQRVVALKRDVTNESHNSVLKYETLTAIQQMAVEITTKDLRQVLIVQRQKRRAIKDKREYEETIIKHIQQVEALFKANLDAILKDCTIGRDKYEESIKEHLKLDVSICMVGTHLNRVLVSRVGSLLEAERQTRELAKEVLTFMIDEYPKVHYIPIHSDYHAEVKEALLMDKVHEKYELEEEDLQQLRRKQDSAEVKALVTKLETEVMKDIKHRMHYLRLD